MADARSDLREVNEAIMAGNDAKSGLEQIIESLESAGNWGTWDMLGGGFVSTAMKHSRIDEAREAAGRVQQLLYRFKRELGDVDGAVQGINIEIGSFETFADYFFDNLITDWVVQSKINNALEGARDALRKVDTILYDLERKRRIYDENIDNLESQKQNMIENL
jgi:hypothetical protein